MNLDRLDLNLFLVFRTIYSEGNLTRAARRLHLSQPALSHALARLREHLDDPLFVRLGHSMVPTPLARSLIEPVRQALQLLEQGLQQGSQFDPAHAQRNFRVALRPVLESTVLPRVMQRLSCLAPQVSLQALAPARQELAAELAAGRIDLALDVDLPLPEDILRQRVGTDTLVVVAAGGCLPAPPDLQQYLQAQHVAVSSRQSGPTVEDMALQRRNLQRRITLRCQHYFAACEVVAASNLLLTMPHSYAQVVARTLALDIQPLPLELPPLALYLYWHRHLDADPANRWLRDLMLSQWQDGAADPG